MGNFCCFCFKNQPKVETISWSPQAEIGEGPHWDAKRQSLYYVDILGGKVLRLDYKQNKVSLPFLPVSRQLLNFE